MNTSRLGVGIIGAGPVTQAIHLPTLSRLEGLFRVAHIADVDASIARSVAGRVGARWSADIDDLLRDPDVEIVAVCSPHQFHADQVIAACRAEKRGVLCEKPFAMDAEQAQHIVDVSHETGVPIVVGAMHTYDPGWLAAAERWGDLPQTAHTIRSSIVLPANARFEDAATEVITRPTPPHLDFRDPNVQAAQIVGGVMGLAIHDLPLVRTFTPDFREIEVLSASFRAPSGYHINARAGGRLIELNAVMNQTAHPRWEFEAISDDQALDVAFTPSYVQAGSARAQLRSDGIASVLGPFGHNGYEEEWRDLAAIAHGAVQKRSTDSLIDDLSFALDIAAKSSAFILEHAQGIPA